MRTLCVDIETYSDKDIKLGVHKYVDSPHFEILLFAYAFDDEPPKVIDFTAGETLPDDVVTAMTDNNVIKTAYNAAFEITCINKVFPDLIIENQWECDSVLALYHSYPMGLGLVAKCLGLEEDKQKDTRGKRLIQYFCKPCKPTKSNGGRTRNLPEHDPEGWAVYVKDGELEWTEMMFGDVTDLLSQLVRTALVPSWRSKFIVADFSAIEARVIAWLANEEWRMKAFAKGEDIYCASASQMFGVPVVKHGVNGELRQRGKVAELALGYGGGVAAMKAMGGDKLDMTDEELQEIVNKWRAASPKIPALWRKIENAAMRTIRFDGTHQVLPAHNIYFDRHDKDLILHLPNGRCLVYLNAGIGENRFGNESIVYDGMIQTTHKMGQLETYGGKLTENLVQAVARDCLGAAMIRLERAGYRIVGHVHRG